MKKDAKTFKEVAERCTRFSPSEECQCGAKNSTAADDVSCKNCKHYTPDKVCTLDLYEEIMQNHQL
ncbi:MAG: hypothetical protein LUH14_04120 [Clostridiaceae bacterium]|nr:hypothetical protein [Clostridiaceae bacterium]